MSPRRSARTTDGPIDLLRAVLDASEHLRGTKPACAGSAELFEPSAKTEDPDIREYRQAAALAACARCPALPACQRWFATETPTHWTDWIVAGQHITQPLETA